MKDGDRLLEMICELRDAKGAKAKAVVLEKYQYSPVFREFLYYALNPLLSYNLSEKTLRLAGGEKYSRDTDLVFFTNYFDCCEYLSRLRCDGPSGKNAFVRLL